jgi:hypothetical protein
VACGRAGWGAEGGGTRFPPMDLAPDSGVRHGDPLGNGGVESWILSVSISFVWKWIWPTLEMD